MVRKLRFEWLLNIYSATFGKGMQIALLLGISIFTYSIVNPESFKTHCCQSWGTEVRLGCLCACVLSRVWLFAILVTHQAPLSMEFSRQEYWSGLSFPTSGDLPHPRDQTCVSCIGRQILHHCATWEAQVGSVARYIDKTPKKETSLMVQWLRFPMEGAWVRSLVREIVPTCLNED